VAVGHLGDSCHVDGMVELAVAPTGETENPVPPEETSTGAVPLLQAKWSLPVSSSTGLKSNYRWVLTNADRRLGPRQGDGDHRDH
jgi:hypothetical protein